MKSLNEFKKSNIVFTCGKFKESVYCLSLKANLNDDGRLVFFETASEREWEHSLVPKSCPLLAEQSIVDWNDEKKSEDMQELQ